MINCQPSLFQGIIPEGGLCIYTDRDQQSIFWGFEFQTSAFFLGYWSKLLYFLGCQINAVFLSVLCLQRYF